MSQTPERGGSCGEGWGGSWSFREGFTGEVTFELDGMRRRQCSGAANSRSSWTVLRPKRMGTAGTGVLVTCSQRLFGKSGPQDSLNPAPSSQGRSCLPEYQRTESAIRLPLLPGGSRGQRLSGSRGVRRTWVPAPIGARLWLVAVLLLSSSFPLGELTSVPLPLAGSSPLALSDKSSFPLKPAFSSPPPYCMGVRVLGEVWSVQ